MAKLLKNEFELLIETWDDPGDYPNALAAGPLPSYQYLAGMEGDARYQLTYAEWQALQADPQAYIQDELQPPLPDGIRQVLSWGCDSGYFTEDQLLPPEQRRWFVDVWSQEDEVDPDYRGLDEPDFRPDDR